jgi:adenosine deaminase
MVVHPRSVRLPTLHAGEQTPELVPREDLRFHISDAIHTGNASRIGHGVDIMEEDDAQTTLSLMAQQDIPNEILLTSYEQTLNVSRPGHPVSVYLSHHVPVVIATDDPGIERTDLTGQYVELAFQHPELSYEQIREINLNSIRYSFLPGPDKELMLLHVQDSLNQFERTTAAKERSPVYLFFPVNPCGYRTPDGFATPSGCITSFDNIHSDAPAIRMR